MARIYSLWRQIYQNLPPKTVFFKFFAGILDYCENRLGITLGPERPTFFPTLGLHLNDMVAFYIKNRQKLQPVEANLAKFALVKVDFSSFSGYF